MPSLAATLFAHALVVAMVVLLPVRGFFRYRRLEREVAAGRPDAKLDAYRRSLLAQGLMVVLVLAFWRLAGVPRAWLGLVLPDHLEVSLGVGAAIVAGAMLSARAVRAMGDRQLRRLLEVAGAILPVTSRERRWFAAVAVGAGLSEELLMRGFLIFYLWQYLPGRDVAWVVAASAAVFGLAHLYQGWRHMLLITLVGACFGWFYLITGSLLLPIIVHAAVDLRLLLIVTPARLQALRDADATTTRAD